MASAKNVIDDSSRLSVICTFCSRLRSIEDHTCDAFPEHIPDEIWAGAIDHVARYAGDGGLQFNRIDVPDGQESELTI